MKTKSVETVLLKDGTSYLRPRGVGGVKFFIFIFYKVCKVVSVVSRRDTVPKRESSSCHLCQEDGETGLYPKANGKP